MRRQSLISRKLSGFNERFSFIFRDIAQIDWLLFVLVTGKDQAYTLDFAMHGNSLTTLNGVVELTCVILECQRFE